MNFNNSNDGQYALVFEPTEVDYLKQIVLAYMTGTDRMVCSIQFIKSEIECLFSQTMAKVICAVLRYTDEQTSSIIDQEKLRQSVNYLNKFYLNSFSFIIIQRWINAPR